MDPFKLLDALIALNLLLAVLAVGMFSGWILMLVHCLRYRTDKDRLLWTLVVMLGGPLGALLYFFMGRQTHQPFLNVASVPPPPFDHSTTHDEKSRAASINRSLQSLAASRKK